jgi:polyisoprenoid-binding protein YceI
MKYIPLIIIFIVSVFNVEAQTYSAQEMYIHFFSPAPISDIEAISNAATATIITHKNEVDIELKVGSFKFKKALMQTHFNEKYIESDKYPNAHFKGKYKDVIDFEKDGTYNITLDGKFSIHGVEKPKTINCSIKIKDKKITFETAFKLKSADYKIKAPDIIYRKVGQEVSIDAKGILIKIKN